MGVHKKNIDPRIFEACCKAQLTEAEIASIFNISNDTLNTRCKEIYGKNFFEVASILRDTGKAEIKIKQFGFAKTNTEMCKWWGKQYLGQKDSPLIDNSNKIIYVQYYRPEKIKNDEINPRIAESESRTELESRSRM